MVKPKEMQQAEETRLQGVIPGLCNGFRLDKALATLFGQYSRSAIQHWIKDGRVTLDGKAEGQKTKVREGQVVVIYVPAPVATDSQAQDIPLDMVYQDEDILVINKPAGLVVHPGTGNPDGTLLNALLHFDESLAVLPRAGIVHRIDKETTGLLVIARNEKAVNALVEAILEKQVRREYLALIVSQIVAGGTIDAPIGRHSRERTKMAVSNRGKPAVTHYRVEEKFRAHTLVRVILETGRTHQIRVHMNWQGHPIIGDPVYGKRLHVPPASSEKLLNALRSFRRQALHAETLALHHPVSGELLSWTVPMPEDMQLLVDALREDTEYAAS
ncbi:MAG: 23S rRNA pseudouridine(1911/1915/1917) synthase RluD [Gammaproteobacteria bacterium]|nr:MAG: 23S rRNA pseudouridine(1911/1915/1917) synthase RluD [Gammaproteobacteria bacterium]